MLLTALTINDSNVDAFVDVRTGNLLITNADLGTHDTIVIERVTVDSTIQGITIDLKNVPLARLAIETVNVNTYTTAAIDINLENVTGLRTISIEDVTATGTDQAIDINLINTDVYALTVEDSNVSGVKVAASGTSDITHGVITENQVSTGGIDLFVVGGATADNFHIVNNFDVRASNRDAIKVSLTDSPLDGLTIENNVIGNEPGADVLFRAEGDTFIQPFELTNNAADGELLQQFVLDLTPLGLVFDTDATFGKPFTAQLNANGTNTGVLTGVEAPVLSANSQILTLTFTDFAPGETLLFVIDVDIAPLLAGGTPQDFSAFGRDLIGAEVDFAFGAGASSGPKTVNGTMVGDANIFNASQFVRGNDESSANFHGINLQLANSPVTNASISSNQITGVAGHGVQVSTQRQSDVSAIFADNTILSSGKDGVHFDLTDSNFTGAIVDNSIGNNGGHGVSFEPKVSSFRLVEGLVDGNPVIITSTNHQLQNGDEIIVQGVVNDDPTVNHTANGVHRVTRIDNNRFSLNGVSGTASNVVYAGGGAWYVPDFQLDGSARGLVEIDVQSTEPQGRIVSFQNIVAADVQVTSLSHGLATGDRIRIDGAAGTGIASTQEFKVTAIDANTFALDGLGAAGPYDTSGGLATWTTNIVENAVDTVVSTEEVVITSQGHGLLTGEEVRVVGMTVTSATETIPSSANGRFVVTKLTADTFLLQGSQANGTYTQGTGYWVPFAEVTANGDKIPQIVSGNSITENGKAGFFVDLTTGTRFDGDIVENTISANDRKGIHILSHSFGLGANLPLNPNDPFAAPDAKDISFDVNIGTSTTDGNDISSNTEAGVVIEALDFATGSFEINGNRINSNITDDNSNDPRDHYKGDGIVVRLDSDRLTSESVAFLSESIIEDNQIGVDSRGNQGNGLSFSQTDRTKIQDLEINSNFFLNSGLDGFHFVRTQDGDLNAVIFDGNDATNNMGDGFDIFAQNTVKDELDFRIRNSNIDNNGEYGIRIEVQADARVAFDLAGVRIRENGAQGGGFNPDDGAGALGQSGGVGIHGFQQVDVDFKANDVQILDNIGDGFSVDAEVFFDALQVDASFVDSELNGNTLTGFRSVGAAFGSYEWLRTDFIGNGTDGARIISNIDVNDFFNRRVGGQDIDVFGLGNNFQLNGESGVVLGMGVSAVFGNGDPTENFSNEFGGTLDQAYKALPAGQTAGNGEDGLKIVQEAGPYLRNEGRRRIIETDGNVFTNNTGDGVDIGHFVATEGGNVLHGEEVISDVHVVLTRADLSNNGGDGVEYLADSIFRVAPVDGGGQDNLANPDISSLSVSKSFIKDNGGRGVDILNRVSEDSRITLFDNEIIGNTLVGVYVVNTTTHDQLQGSPSDPLEADYGDGFTFRDPNIELRVQDNLIESNGTATQTTTVPINDDLTSGDTNPNANPNYAPVTNQIPGTSGGLVIRVGTTDTVGFRRTANPERELSQSGIDAEVWKNSFDGNFGADVYFDNFVSAVPDRANDLFDLRSTPQFRWIRGTRDPLARLDLSFRENEGNSLDVINGFAFLDNEESLFKSRGPSSLREDGGPFSDFGRKRNATRTLGYFNNVGDDPGDTNQWGFSGGDLQGAAPGGFWSYDGWGTPTWRVESDFDFNNFDDISPIFGLSSFFDRLNLGFSLAEEEYQWDTGINVPGFIGATPFSLQRGDIFNVRQNEAPIAPDELEENDNFLGATQLLTNPITGAPAPLSGVFLVNSLTTDGNLNIERKGDRDYYSFVAAASGTLEVTLSQTDAVGDFLSFLVYEVDEAEHSSEVAMIRAANGVPLRTTVAVSSSGLIAVSAVAGRTYIVEVLSEEGSNVSPFAVAGKNFEFGTVRSYSLSINAPVGPAPVVAAAPVASPPILVTASQPGVLAAASVAGQNPSLDSITTITPNPISAAVNTITVHFDEDVTGVDRSDFRITRNTLPLNTSGILVNQIDAQTYAITNLAELTNEAGSYQFRLVVAGSNIIDTDSAPLLVSGLETTSWVLDNTVNFFGDSTDNIPGDGDIKDVNGNRSLRAAINEANANVGNDIIELAAGTYVLSLGGRFEDEGLSGDLDIRETLTIRGKGARASDTVIDANQIDRVFHVFPGVELILENLTIMGGEAYDGAGLFIEGSTTTSGIAAGSAAVVRMTDVNVIDNEAYNQGGGIYNLGTVDALRSSISRNIAGSRGGGIFNHGITDLLNVTVSSNFAVSRGGGIYNEVLATAVNGEIRPVVAAAELRAVNSTIAFNHAESAGGGLYQEATAVTQIGNTIIDQNTANQSPNMAAVVTTLGNNFVGNLGLNAIKATFGLGQSDFIPDATKSIFTAGLNLLTGGSTNANGTWVHTLSAASFAVDKGSNTVFATAADVSPAETTLAMQLDQTGSVRLVRANTDPALTRTIDIGASEFFLSQPIALFTARPNPAGAGEIVNFDGTFSTHSLVPGRTKIVSYEWDFSYDGTTFVPETAGDEVQHIYNAEGINEVALRVRDDDNVTDIFVVTVTVAAPSAPVITKPFDGGTSDSTPVISWTGGSGNFRLVVTSLSTGLEVINEPSLTTTSYTPTNRLVPGLYRAVVTAVNLSGEENSLPYDFEVIRIAVNNPAQGSLVFDTTPEFTFTAIPDAATYQIWVSELNPADQSNLGVPINVRAIDAAAALIPGTQLATYEPPNALPEGFYRVWARAVDVDGNAGDWSAGNAFTITKPIITGPAFQTKSTIDSTPTITWTDIDANQYQVWLTQLNGTTANGTDLTAPQLVSNTDFVPGTSLTPPAIGNGDFRVWVRAIGDDGEAGLWSDPYDFKRDLRIGPQLISPTNGFNQTDRTPAFVWEAPEGATHYELWVNRINGASRIIQNVNIPHVQGADIITYTDPTVTLFTANYRWWVRAFNEDGAVTDWSTSATFFVPIPIITAPTGTVTTTNLPTFTWTGVPEYVSYELWVNNVDTGQSRVIFQQGIVGTSFTAALPLENGTFRFWVRGIDANGNPSQYSAPVTFDVNSTIGTAPVLVSPTNFLFGLQPTFTWSPSTSTNVINYEILVKQLLGTSQPTVLNQVVPPTVDLFGNINFTPSTILQSGSYRWWVRGLNGDGSPGPWSQPLDFFASIDRPQTQEGDSATVEPVMLASLHNNAWSDDLVNITVHPAAVVALMTEPVVEVSSEAKSEEADHTNEVDSVMEELATADWWRLDAESSETEQLIVLSEANPDVELTVQSESGKQQVSASALGLALAAVTSRGRSRKRDEE